MKKIAIICLLLCLSLSLCGCDPTWYTYGDFSLTDITRIELVYYHFEDAVVYNYIGRSTEKILPFEFEKMEVLETLPDESVGDFLEELAPLRVWSGYHANSPSGFSLRLTYGDGSFLLVSILGSFVCHYDATGEIRRVIGEPVSSYGYYKIIREYFNIKI